MAYLQSHRGDYLGSQQGGIPLLGGVIGWAAKKAIGFVGRKLGGTPARRAFTSGVGAGLALPTNVPLPGGYSITPRAFLPGGQPLITKGTQAGAAGEMVPKGYRLNKTGYHTKDGQYHAPGTKLVKIRRRNFANGRALNRSIGRVQGFERMVKRSRKSLRSLSRI